MPISIIADKVEEIPEALRTTAKEDNGKFVLQQMPDGWGIDNVAVGRQKLTKLEQDLKRRDDRLKGYAIDDKGTIPEPDQFKEMLAELARLKEAQGKAPDIEKLRKQIVDDAEQRWGKKLSEAEKAQAAALAELDDTVREASISGLLAELRPKSGKADLVKLLLREKVRLDKAEGKRVARPVGADGNFLPGPGPDGYMPLKDWGMNSLRTQYADLFEGDGASGAGATGTGGRVGANVLTFKRSDLNGKAGQFLELQRRAAKEGKTVEIID
jgi:hypothetical protein